MIFWVNFFTLYVCIILTKCFTCVHNSGFFSITPLLIFNIFKCLWNTFLIIIPLFQVDNVVQSVPFSNAVIDITNATLPEGQFTKVRLGECASFFFKVMFPKSCGLLLLDNKLMGNVQGIWIIMINSLNEHIYKHN